jgi:PAS domain S-box-containing protein
MSDLIIPNEQRMAHERGLRHFLETGDGPILRRRIEITAVRRSGVECPIELQVMPLKLGQDWFFSAFIRDITESKRAQELLRQSEFNLRQMTETIPGMLWSATGDEEIDYCNRRALDYLGVPAEELMGDRWRPLLHPDDLERAAQSWSTCLATGDPFRIEVRFFRAIDLTYRWCITSALPLLDQRGRILKSFGTIVDMHDWKQSQEELRKTQADLAHVTRVMTMGQLTASIAHEVSQSLSGIMTNADTCLSMLDSDPPNIDGARVTARRTIRDANRAADVITRLRDLYRKKDAATELVDLNDAAREVIALSLSELQSNRILLKYEFDENLPAVKGDRIQIQQVILNLLHNASDSMRDVDDRPRQLLIKTEGDDSNNVRFTLQNSGIGFAPNASDRLFESFYTTKDDGMGIGLSICRSIIEAHRGRLWASANDGPGSSFAFSIPLDFST